MYDGKVNYLLHEADFSYYLNENCFPQREQYIARFKLSNDNFPKIWNWDNFKTIYDNKTEYFNEFYKLREIYNRQDLYIRTGTILRNYNIK